MENMSTRAAAPLGVGYGRSAKEAAAGLLQHDDPDAKAEQADKEKRIRIEADRKRKATEQKKLMTAQAEEERIQKALQDQRARKAEYTAYIKAQLLHQRRQPSRVRQGTQADEEAVEDVHVPPTEQKSVNVPLPTGSPNKVGTDDSFLERTLSGTGNAMNLTALRPPTSQGHGTAVSVLAGRAGAHQLSSLGSGMGTGSGSGGRVPRAGTGTNKVAAAVANVAFEEAERLATSRDDEASGEYSGEDDEGADDLGGRPPPPPPPPAPVQQQPYYAAHQPASRSAINSSPLLLSEHMAAPAPHQPGSPPTGLSASTGTGIGVSGAVPMRSRARRTAEAAVEHAHPYHDGPLNGNGPRPQHDGGGDGGGDRDGAEPRMLFGSPGAGSQHTRTTASSGRPPAIPRPRPLLAPQDAPAPRPAQGLGVGVGKSHHVDDVWAGEGSSRGDASSVGQGQGVDTGVGRSASRGRGGAGQLVGSGSASVAQSEQALARPVHVSRRATSVGRARSDAGEGGGWRGDGGDGAASGTVSVHHESGWGRGGPAAAELEARRALMAKRKEYEGKVRERRAASKARTRQGQEEGPPPAMCGRGWQAEEVHAQQQQQYPQYTQQRFLANEQPYPVASEQWPTEHYLQPQVQQAQTQQQRLSARIQNAPTPTPVPMPTQRLGHGGLSTAVGTRPGAPTGALAGLPLPRAHVQDVQGPAQAVALPSPSQGFTAEEAALRASLQAIDARLALRDRDGGRGAGMGSPRVGEAFPPPGQVTGVLAGLPVSGGSRALAIALPAPTARAEHMPQSKRLSASKKHAPTPFLGADTSSQGTGQPGTGLGVVPVGMVPPLHSLVAGGGVSQAIARMRAVAGSGPSTDMPPAGTGISAGLGPHSSVSSLADAIARTRSIVAAARSPYASYEHAPGSGSGQVARTVRVASDRPTHGNPYAVDASLDFTNDGPESDGEGGAGLALAIGMGVRHPIPSRGSPTHPPLPGYGLRSASPLLALGTGMPLTSTQDIELAIESDTFQVPLEGWGGHGHGQQPGRQRVSRTGSGRR